MSSAETIRLAADLIEREWQGEDAPLDGGVVGTDTLVRELREVAYDLQRETNELRLEVWNQYALDMGDGWQSDGALSTLETIIDDLVDAGLMEQHPEREWYRMRATNVRDHRAGPDDPSKAEPTIVAGSGASTCWADAQSAGGMP
jgi:uncharacterized protein YijF (DUF1287 family)